MQSVDDLKPNQAGIPRELARPLIGGTVELGIPTSPVTSKFVFYYYEKVRRPSRSPCVPAVALIEREFRFPSRRYNDPLIRLERLLLPLIALAGLGAAEPPPGREVHRQVDPRSAKPEGTLDAPKDEAAPVPRRCVRGLFEQGMANPRGCEYREVEIVEGWTFKTRAFVLPERPGDTGRYALSWDGVIHPASSVGPAADLDADIRALADSMRLRSGRRCGREGGGPQVARRIPRALLTRGACSDREDPRAPRFHPRSSSASCSDSAGPTWREWRREWSDRSVPATTSPGRSRRSRRAPRCELYWTREKRDEAVEACVTFLKTYGDRFTARVPSGEHVRPNERRAHLAFPNLDRPATKDDVRAARAIFSLEGEGEVRRIELPSIPIKARWIPPGKAPADMPRTVGCGKPRRFAKAASGNAITASSAATSSHGSRPARSSWPSVSVPPLGTAEKRKARINPGRGPCRSRPGQPMLQSRLYGTLGRGLRAQGGRVAWHGRETVGFGLVLAGCLAVYFHETVVGGRILSPADVLLVESSFRTCPDRDYEPLNRLLMDPVLQFQPWLEFNRTMLRQGRLPLWNPPMQAVDRPTSLAGRARCLIRFT